MKKSSKIKQKMKAVYSKDRTKTALASLFSVFAGLLSGVIIIIAVSAFDSDIGLKSGIEGLKLILFGAFSRGRDSVGELSFGFNAVNIGNILFRATPVIMTGLSVAFAFKAGLFNIGAPGQYLAGTAATLILALKIPSEHFSPAVIWLIAFFGGMVAGALWGAVPGALKAYLNVNEILSGIMTNWIAGNGVTWIFENSLLRNLTEPGKAGYIMKTSVNGIQTADFGLNKLFGDSRVNGGIIIAVLFAGVTYVIITKTVFGYEMRVCGLNRDAAEYSGIKSVKTTVLSMAFAGALSGGGAALYYLSGNTEFFRYAYQVLPSEGFSGIPVALLAGTNPVAVIFTGIFMSSLSVSGQQLKNLTPFNEYIVDIITGVTVYFSAFSLIIKGRFFSGKKSDITDLNKLCGKTINSEVQRKTENGGKV